MIPPAESSGAKVQFMREVDQIEDHAGEWRRLAVERGNAFLTPEWFCSWWRHYGDNEEPLVGIVRSADGQLQGLLPLVVSAGRRSRTARFAGSSLGDHFHPVAPVEREVTVATEVGRSLNSDSRSPVSLLLENVDADAAWWSELSHSSGSGSRPLVGRRSTLWSVRLAGRTWEEYLASRSRNLRSQVGRKLRALEREHQVRFRWTEARGEVAEDMATLFRLHDMRWDARAGTSSLTSERARAFHTDFASAAHERGWLRLCFLEVDGEPVAGWYGWLAGSRFAYYQAGFDPAWSDRSVGLVLFSETIRAAAAEGAAEYAMLLGEEPFKQRFADTERPICTVLVAPRLRPSRLLAATELGVQRASRRLPDSLRGPAKRRVGALLKRLPMARRR